MKLSSLSSRTPEASAARTTWGGGGEERGEGREGREKVSGVGDEGGEKRHVVGVGGRGEREG